MGIHRDISSAIVIASDGQMVRVSAFGAVDAGLIPSWVKPMALKLVLPAPCLTLSIKFPPKPRMLHDNYLCLVESNKPQIKEVRSKTQLENS